MAGSEAYLAQALQWAAEENVEFDTQLCVDLPDLGWITVHSIKEEDGDVTCEYTSGWMSRTMPNTIIFPVGKITAARRSESFVNFFQRDKD